MKAINATFTYEGETLEFQQITRLAFGKDELTITTVEGANAFEKLAERFPELVVSSSPSAVTLHFKDGSLRMDMATIDTPKS